MKADKDFKEANNYREVECCGNCKHSSHYLSDMWTCFLDDSFDYTGRGYICDKWEHE